MAFFEGYSLYIKGDTAGTWLRKSGAESLEKYVYSC